MSDRCKLCKNRQTTNHCLNICNVALDTERFTWRHNNLKNDFYSGMPRRYNIHRYIPGHEAPGEGHVPQYQCSANNSRIDLSRIYSLIFSSQIDSYSYLPQFHFMYIIPICKYCNLTNIISIHEYLTKYS